MLHEEQRLWSNVCEYFDRYLDQANTHDLRDIVDELLERTRRENVSVWEWKEVLDDLAERVSAIEDYAGLGPGSAAPPPLFRRAPVTRQVDIGFGCPGGLCDRRISGGLLDPTPRCRILAREMTLLT